MTKLIVRDGQHFSSIKFFDCDTKSKEFAEVLTMVLKNNATSSLVVKGGNVNGNTTNEGHRPFSQVCESMLGSLSNEASIAVALREGLLMNNSLKSLRLSGLNFKNEGPNTKNHGDSESCGDEYDWCKMLIHKTTLRNLDLSGSPLSTSTATNLSNALSLNKSLQYLDLTGCYLDDQSLSKILKSLQEHPSLTKLNLSRNFLGKSASTLALDAVAQLLRSKCSNLACLVLSQQQHPRLNIVTNAFENSMYEGELEKQRHQIAFARALNALSTNTTLRMIDFSGNSHCLSDLTSLEALSSCLVTNTGLLHVNASSCDLTPFAIEYLAKNCIPHCSRRLKSLVLFDDETSEIDVENKGWTTAQSALFSALQTNKTLETFGQLDGVITNFESRNRFQHLLNLNRAGRRALAANDLPLGAWSHVLARAGRTEIDNRDHDLCNITDTIESPTISSTKSTAASVVFALLHGPALLDNRQQ